jgi:hypothetical protein
VNRRTLIRTTCIAALAALAPLASALQLGGDRLHATLTGPRGTGGAVEVFRNDRTTVVTVKAFLPVTQANVWLAGTPYALDTSTQDGYATLVLDSRQGTRIPVLVAGQTVGVTSGGQIWLKGVLEKAK